MNKPAPADTTNGRQGRWLAVILAVADPLSIAGFYVYLLSRSWLRWMDPLVDFPKDLYVAWRMSEGDLLYQKVVNWYGPLAHLVEAAGFRIFGVGLDTIVWMNIALTAVIVLLLRGIFSELGGRLMSWLAPIVFLGVFAIGHYTLVANYNFITPYTAAATYTFAGLLLVLWGLLKHLKSERPFWLGVAGLGLAVAYLDKPEGLLASAGALGIYLLSRCIQILRQKGFADGQQNAGHWLLRAAGWLCAGFLGLWLPVFAYLFSRSGLAYAWHAANFVPYSVLGGTFSEEVGHSRLLQMVFGFDEPGKNFIVEFKTAGGLVLVCLLMTMAARSWAHARTGSLSWVVLLLAVVIPVLAGLRLVPKETFWLNMGAAFVIPVCLATIYFVGRSLEAAWRGRAGHERVLGLATLGAAASLMMARMILNGRLSHYGFFMMPLAVLFWIQLMVVEAARPAPGDLRRNWLLPAAFSAIVLLGVSELGRLSLDAYAFKIYEVGEGRDHLYTYLPSQSPNGWLLNTMLQASKMVAPKAKTLVAFPEGIAVNYYLRIPSPLSELELHPLALSYVGPDHVLAELKAHPPDVVFLFARDLTEDGVPYFGADEASGRGIVRWLSAEYKVVGHAGSSPFNLTGHGVDFLLPNSTPDPSTPAK